jgi:hypothetical protein
MAEVVKREGGEPTMGQSPFAILRGRSFEKSLMGNSAQPLREALAKARVLPTPEARFIDLRPAFDDRSHPEWTRLVVEGPDRGKTAARHPA